MILHNIDQERKTSPEEAIILMGHGSRDSEGAEEFLIFVERVASRLSRPVYPGFLELAEPPIVTTIQEVVQVGVKTILAVPWMLLGAGHVKNDLPSAIQVARRRNPEITIQYGTPITVQPELLSVLGDRLAAIDPHNGLGSPDTAVLLVQRGSSDPDANAEVYRVARLLWEGRNFVSVEVAFSGITKPTIQEGLLRCFVPGVTRVLVLPYFLYTGILVKRIAQIVAETALAHPEYEFRVAEHMGQDTQLDELAVRLIEQTRNGKASMSCDLCQYRTPLFGREFFVGMPQVSDHSHGLRGTTTDEQRVHKGGAFPLTPATSAAPMGSAPLINTEEGQVAWDQMWQDFCDLAVAGGPPHRGTLLEPVSPTEVENNRDAYECVVAEIERGLRLVTGLTTTRCTTLGWVGLVCSDEETALWLLQSMSAENVSVRREGPVLFVPAGPTYRLEKEIKNVVTAVAKTHHYWMEHRFS
ncbi:MAG: sirohydrochlorin chelatase [Ktedonobacteraceae bacterium]